MKSLWALALFVLGAGSVHASVLVGVRLHLTTTTIPSDTVYSSVTHPNGLTQIISGQQEMGIQMPAQVIDGYLIRSSRDHELKISSTTKPAELGKRAAVFVFDKDLVKLKYPREVLVNTESLNGLLVPINLIEKVEKLSGRFEGSHGLGEPFFIEGWKAALMKGAPPVYTCTPPTERSELVWVSYNPQVGEKEMKQLCEQALPEAAVVGPLLKKGNIFLVTYPAD